VKPPDDLDKPVRYLKGVGPKRADLLAGLGIRTIGDLLYHLPRGYDDRSHIVRIGDLKPGQRATIRARVESVSRFRLTLVWFEAAHLKEADFAPGREMFFSGKVDHYPAARRLQMVAPHFEDAAQGAEGALYTSRILPEYPLAGSLSQTFLRRIVREALDGYVDRVPEVLPEALRAARKLPPVHRALADIHFPDSREAAGAARRRMAYEDFFVLEMGMALRRQSVRRTPGIAFRIWPALNARFRSLFPFEPTAAQQRAIGEIAEDMQRPEPMNRLLQGDVGSGKTLVAMYPLLVAVANGYQSAIMAPTEILAEQHYRRFSAYLARGRVRMRLLRGGSPAAERRRHLAEIAAGEVDLVVGTQALIQRDVAFGNLGVVVVDEQHKFGVLQRHRLRTKGRRPDVLVMTATPIPRTLALTVFGDLDVSVLDEMPPGRRPVTTRVVAPADLPKAYRFIAGRVARGEQGYIVYPLVETSERLAVRAATEMAERLQRGPFRAARVGLLHGRMSADEKERAMEAFRRHDLDLLVATQVVEVGVDVPDATVMLVEHAERFGLAQLHQLRGRIGRGARRSWFLVSAEPATEEARRRIAVLARTSDGFRIAEEDLRLRGPGEFFGTRDYPLLRLARKDAFGLVGGDPALEAAEHRDLRRAVERRFGEQLELIHVG